MQYYLNGFKPGDPTDFRTNVDPVPIPPLVDLPDAVDVLIVGCGPAGLMLAAPLAAFPEIRTRIVEHLRIPVDAVRTIEVYTIDGDLTPAELAAAAKGPLSDPVIQNHSIDSGLAPDFDWLIEVGFRPAKELKATL